MRARHKLLIALILSLIVTGCGGEGQNQQAVQPQGSSPFIIAVNNPLHYFTSRLLGDSIDVRMLAPADEDPALWRPTVDDIGQLQQARLVILNGAGYSSWPDKVSISSGKLVTSSAGLQEQLIPLEQQTTHSHGPEGEHAHADTAFTLWMDLSLAQAQSETIAKALVQAWPQYRESIESNLASLLADLAQLDSQYQQWASSVRGRQIVFSHPVYQYFERRYQLSGTSLHWEPDQMPAPRQWEELQALAERSGTLLLVWEAPPEKAIVEKLQELDIAWVVIDPGAAPGDSDWLTLQKNNLASLAGQ